MLEWPATLDAVGEKLPELEPWLMWCTTEPDHVRLPCGDWVTSDRGTGQGEPEGQLIAALTTAQAVRRARADLELAGVLCPGAWWSSVGSWWFTPRKWIAFFGRWIVDCRRLGPRGARRLKAHIPDGEGEACRGWCTDYIVDTCEVISLAKAASKVLGVEPDSKLSQQFEEVMAKVVALHVNIEGICDAGVETVLKSECVGVSKVVHILRAWGPAGQ